MNKKNYTKALAIITISAFILNWLFLNLFDTEVSQSARNLFDMDANFGIGALQNTSMLIFLFIVFYFSQKIGSSLRIDSNFLMTSSIFGILVFILLLLPSLSIWVDPDSFQGDLQGSSEFFFTQYFTTCLLIGACTIIINDYSANLEIVKSLKGIFLYSIKTTLLIALLQFCLIGIMISTFNISVEDRFLWPYDGSFWQRLFIQPFIIIFHFCLGAFLLNRFQATASESV